MLLLVWVYACVHHDDDRRVADPCRAKRWYLGVEKKKEKGPKARIVALKE